jgi:excisionase family DNA binding protein
MNVVGVVVELLLPSSLERLERLLEDIRTRIDRLEERMKPEPTCCTYPQAAKRLGIGLTKMKSMVRRGEIRTVLVGKAPMIPAAEIQRLSTPDLPPPPRSGKRAGQTQDPAALLARRRR